MISSTDPISSNNSTMDFRFFDKCISAVDNDEDENMNISDLDSDSDSSDSESHEVSIDFAEKLLNYGIQCRNFWQYNLQSRGPKAKRVLSPIDETDFHILSKCVDPVNDSIDLSSADNSSLLMRQNRKGRFQPDVVRLLSIGSRIERLENKHKMLATSSCKMKKIIGKEKNKIASRICRLRRKAQHESNKIKLQGLDREHGQLMQVCVSLLLVMDCFFNQVSQGSGEAGWTSNLTDYLKAFISNYLSFMVAGHTAAYVNKELATAAEKIIAENKEEPSIDNQT